MNWHKKVLAFLCVVLLATAAFSETRYELPWVLMVTLLITVIVAVVGADSRKRMSVSLAGGVIGGLALVTAVDVVARGQPMPVLVSLIVAGFIVGVGFGAGVLRVPTKSLRGILSNPFAASEYDPFAPRLILEQDANSLPAQSGLAWRNAVPNKWARKFGWGGFWGLCGLSAFTFVAHLGFRSYNSTGWGARQGAHSSAEGFFLLLSFIIFIIAVVKISLARSRSEEPSQMVFTPTEARMKPPGGNEVLVPLDEIVSIEETPVLSRGGSQFMMADPQFPKQVYPARNVTVMLSSGVTVHVGTNLRPDNARIVLAQLNKAMSRMRQMRAVASQPHMDDW